MDGLGFLDRLFPKKYDFFKLLKEQSRTNFMIVEALGNWLVSRDDLSYNEVFLKKNEADKIRFQLEADLVKAFSTPFSRADLYYISVSMNRVAHYSKMVLKKIKILGIETDSTILSMVKLLIQGSLNLSEAIEVLATEPSKSQELINSIRLSQSGIEDMHILGLKSLYEKTDILEVVRYQEVYSTLLMASMSLDETVDVYHRICVRLV